VALFVYVVRPLPLAKTVTPSPFFPSPQVRNEQSFKNCYPPPHFFQAPKSETNNLFLCVCVLMCVCVLVCSCTLARSTAVQGRNVRVAATGRKTVMSVVAEDKKAVCVLTGTAGVEGTVTFTQSGDGRVVQNGCTERLYRTVVQNGCTQGWHFSRHHRGC
jgi:hypothetical protein